ncbi:MAG: alpha-2-macroglobulin, partial [Anaerolineae bacterium]|nr:alpha-2-macroglobulin [Anaerolineae bacterium]
PLYQVGDTAKILVPHPFSGPVEALLTIERGEIIETQLLTIDGNSETLEIPITEEHVPNIFVSVALVKGEDAASDALGSFKLGYAMLPVDPVVKELNVVLTASQSQLKPGDTVTFDVEVTDNAGNPVETELSLALIDKALLALATQPQGTLMDTFYRQRGLGVQTASTLVYNLNRINQQLQEGTKGGGGGGDGMAGTEVRSEFQDAALWEPTLVTDADGRGQVTVTLPDNLTTWQLDGKAVTVDTKVGQATIEIQTTLPLLVRPVLPRFFTAGDKADIAAIVNNNTEEDRTVEVTLASEAVTTDKPLSQIVAVPARGQVKVSWPVDVPAPDGGLAVTPGVIRFSVEETSGATPLADAVEITVPIQRYSSPETVATAGTVALGEERTEIIVLPSDVDPTQGELRVQLDPSLAAGMIASLDWLQNFPYDCNEQIISKFLANLVTYEALAGLGVEDAAMQAQLETAIATAVQKLQRRQNADGGWGWWGNEKSSPFTSTYVAYGLLRAQNAGFGVDQTTIDRSLDYLTRQLVPVASAQGWELNQQAFILYVLALAGQGDTGRTVALYDVRERLAHYGEAWLALAFEQLSDAGEPTAEERIDTIIDDLLGSAIVSATGAHWEEDRPDRMTMNTDTRSTALALDVLARLDPDALTGIAPNAVRWLMVDRKDGVWSTTQENVWSIIALTDWMLKTGELEGDYSYSVALNASELDNGVVTPENVDEPVALSIAVRDMLLEHANALTIARFAEGAQTGDGQLYYTSYLNYFLPAASLQAMDRGIVLAREVSKVDPLTGKVVEQNVGEAAVGDTLQVKLTIVAPTNLNYLIVESPLPAGAEAIDPSLLTTSIVYQEPGLEPVDGNTDIWHWTPTSTELRDEKVVMFATDLPAGTYEYTYQMRASLPGEFQTLPAVAYQMYFPEVWGRSAGAQFTITE